MKLKRGDKKGCQVKMVKKVAGAPARQRFVVAATAAAFIRIDVGHHWIHWNHWTEPDVNHHWNLNGNLPMLDYRLSIEDRIRHQPSLESFVDRKELDIHHNWNQKRNLPMLELDSFRGQNRTSTIIGIFCGWERTRHYQNWNQNGNLQTSK